MHLQNAGDLLHAAYQRGVHAPCARCAYKRGPKPQTVPARTGDWTQSGPLWLGLALQSQAYAWDWLGLGNGVPPTAGGLGAQSL